MKGYTTTGVVLFVAFFCAFKFGEVNYDFRKDAFTTGLHACLLQRKYTHAEIALSCPRLRPIINNDKINPKDVHERQFLQIITAYRIFLHFANITISTRECANFRYNVIGLAATKISDGVSVVIGGHDNEEAKGDGQFEISDGRTVSEIYDAIVSHGLQSVMSDYIYVNRHLCNNDFLTQI